MPSLTTPLRPPSGGGASSSSGSSFASRVILLLTVLPLALASFAFVLQWRGGLNDPASAWPTDTQRFPGMENSPIGSSSSFFSVSSSSSSSDCAEILGRSSSPSFPFYHGWKFDFDSDPRPKAIIHGLKESGVFSNVVGSAKSLSKEKFLSSMEKLQNKSSLVPNSMTVGTQSLRSSNRKIGSHTESQVTGRKVLEIPVIQEKAVLPSSPPRLEDLHREFHEYLAD
ncbi:hypothetical protein B296_00032256 [Ensete ventricosum]|uniref:Uncharacterized protein n=1 Tax=Ensete ventricosum TaxID=4639 RepID=A0A426Z4R8_ENSVE|nr:hypothetical protein B296_00032256 [Ensete ventricosum]